MRFEMPHHPCKFEIPDEWLVNVPVKMARGALSAYRPSEPSMLIRLADIEPPVRKKMSVSEWRGFDRTRFMMILNQISAGIPLEPVTVFELPWLQSSLPPHRYRTRDGYHRFYASIVAGFDSLSCLVEPAAPKAEPD